MKDFVSWISGNTARTVVDKTGYTGKFDAAVEWAPDGPPRNGPGDDSSKPAPDVAGPSIFTALQEQLGLKLESTKGPVEVLVIDHVEKPTAN
jgi:bla regulator protein blaR1